MGILFILSSTASMTQFLAIVVTHVESVPFLGSNEEKEQHALQIALLVISSMSCFEKKRSKPKLEV